MLWSRLSAKRYLLLVPFLLTLSQLAVAVNPTLTDPNLQVTTVITGLSQPTGIAFLGPNDWHYRGRIHSWDVVNEAINVDDGHPDGLRKSQWLNLLGPQYLDIAFTAAAKAD